MMEIPPSRSEPNSRFRSFRNRSYRRGTPPIASVISSGIREVVGVARKPKRSARCARIAATESAAMTVVLRCHGCDGFCSVSSTNSGPLRACAGRLSLPDLPVNHRLGVGASFPAGQVTPHLIRLPPDRPQSHLLLHSGDSPTVIIGADPD